MSQPGMTKESKARSIAAQNRRASIRYRCAPATLGKIISTDDHEMQRAWVLDLSQKGIGMQVARPIESGRLVIIAMKSNIDAKIFELPAHIVYCNPLAHGEWHAGCELITPLTPEELEQLL